MDNMELPPWRSPWLKDKQMPEAEKKIITREQWGALPPKGGIDPLPIPVEYVGFSCNRDITPNKCSNRKECSKVMRQIQRKHMADGFPDIKYNFLIGEDGYVYEGRGWIKRPQIYYERPIKKSYESMVDVAYIGISKLLRRTEYHANMLKWFCDYGVRKLHIYLDYGQVNTNRQKLYKDFDVEEYILNM